MNIFSSTLIIIVLPLAIIIIVFIIYFLFRMQKVWAVWKDAKDQLKDERNRIVGQNRPMSKDEYETYKERGHKIIEEHRKQSHDAAIEVAKDLGLEDLKQGNKEIIDELLTKDIKGLFSLKDIFRK